MGDEYAFYFAHGCGHVLGSSVSSSAACFCIVSAGHSGTDLDILHELSKISSGGALPLVGWPVQEQGSVWLIGEDLKDPGVPCLRYVNEESAIKELNLVEAHGGGAAPVGPSCFVLFVVVIRSKVNHGVYEAEHEAFGGPVDDYIDCHVI